MVGVDQVCNSSFTLLRGSQYNAGTDLSFGAFKRNFKFPKDFKCLAELSGGALAVVVEQRGLAQGMGQRGECLWIAGASSYSRQRLGARACICCSAPTREERRCPSKSWNYVVDILTLFPTLKHKPALFSRGFEFTI